MAWPHVWPLTKIDKKLKKSRRSAAGSASRSGREGRGFKSRRLDQNSRITIGGTAVFDSTACDGIWGWEPFCESKTLCLTKLGLWKTWRQRTTLITSERGAPLKAQIPDAHSSLFRRYAPYCLDQKMQEIAWISCIFYLFFFNFPFFVYCVSKFEGWRLIFPSPLVFAIRH